MKYTIHKWFWAWDFEKEEHWLNEMSAKGLQLVGIGWCKYTFQEGRQNEYNYKLELLENLPSHAESISYIRFLEETGVEYIGSLLRWIYLRKKTEYGEFDIYSDINSKMKHYKRISALIGILGLSNVLLIPSNATSYFNNKYPSALLIFILNVSLATLLVFGYFVIYKKIKKLKNEKKLYE